MLVRCNKTESYNTLKVDDFTIANVKLVDYTLCQRYEMFHRTVRVHMHSMFTPAHTLIWAWHGRGRSSVNQNLQISPRVPLYQ